MKVMNKPLVTIITPVYNCAEFVEETILSVVCQDYRNLEYIVIDDASTDGFDIEGDGDFTVICHKANQGEQRTVNEGLKLVRGKYFMIVNADDPLLLGAVSKLVSFMELNPTVLCGYPDYNVIGEGSKVRWRVISRHLTWHRIRPILISKSDIII